MIYKKHLLIPVVWAAIILHTLWAIMLIMPDEMASGSTPVHAIVETFGGITWLAVVAMFTASAAALWSLSTNGMWKILLVIPQQLLLGVSAAAGVRAAWVSHYADGVERPADFILADQMPSIGLFLAHSATVIILFILLNREDVSG